MAMFIHPPSNTQQNMSTIQSTPAPEDQSAPSDPPAPVFAISIFNHTAYMPERLPFDVVCDSIVPIVQDNGQIHAVRSQTSLVHSDPGNLRWSFRRQLLPVIANELRRLGVRFRVVVSHRTRAGTDARAALLQHQFAALEYQDRMQMIDFIGRLANNCPSARIAVLASSRNECWRVRQQLSQRTSSQSLVVVRDLTDAELARHHRAPQIIIGMPDTLVGNVDFTAASSFDIFIIADKRVLYRERLFDFLVPAKPGARIYTCLPSDVMCDPKWQAKIYEYGGLTRGLLLGGGGVLPQPRIAIANINWNVSGDDVSTTDAECARACDNENRRMRAIEQAMGRRQNDDSLRTTYLVFATRNAADKFCSLDGTFLRYPDQGSVFGPATRLALHSDQLKLLRVAGDNLFVWAGARSEPIDLYRTLANQIVDTAELAFLDLQDFPQGRGGAGSSLASIARDWNRTRRQTYARWGYLPEGDDTAALRIASRVLIRPRGANPNE